jgi:hypothetical protein
MRHAQRDIRLIVETVLTKVQKLTALALPGMLIAVVILSTIHLGVR